MTTNNSYSGVDGAAAAVVESPAGSVDADSFRQFRRFLIGSALLLGVVVWLLPWGMSRLIENGSLDSVLPHELAGQVRIGTASLGWQSPVMLNDVTLSDASGRPLLEAKSIVTRQTFWSLWRRVEQPLVLEVDGLKGNFVIPELEPQLPTGELHLAEWLDRALRQSLPRIDREMTVKFSDSELQLRDRQSRVLAHWKPIRGEFRTQPGTEKEHSLQLHAHSATGSSVSLAGAAPNPPAGELTLTTHWTREPSGRRAERLSVELMGLNQSLSALDPLLSATLPELLPLPATTGTLQGHIERFGQEELNLLVQSRFVDHATGAEVAEASGEYPARLGLDVDASYSKPQDRLDVRRLFAQLDATAVDGTGQVTEVAGQQQIDATGTFQSPAEGLSKLLPEGIKDHVKFEEIQLSNVSIRGPLRPDPQKPFDIRFELSTTASWKGGTAFGLESEQGRVELKMMGNEISLIPLELPIAGGHIRQLPKLNLGTDPITVSIAEGPVLDRVELNETVCRDWLRYVSPLLANATGPSGTFSLETAAGEFQLGKIDAAELSGKLQIHQGQVRPGGLAQEVIELVRTAQAVRAPQAGQEEIVWMKLPPQEISYRISEGRVQHSQFVFLVGNIPLASRGSVGFDETLDLVISMGFPQDLGEGRPLLQLLQGEQLNFRVTGTTDKPVIDAEPLKEFGKRMGAKAAAGLIERLIERRQQRSNPDR